MNKTSAIHILNTLAAAIRSGDSLEEADAADLAAIAAYLVKGTGGL